MQEKTIDNLNNHEVQRQNNKNTKKNKADISKTTKNTRRRKPSDSQQQNLLPAEIPRSTQTSPIVSEGHQNQLTKVVIRVPLGLLKQERKDSFIIIEVQKTQLAIKLSKQQENLTFQLILKNNKIQQKADDSNSSEEQITKAFNIAGKYVYLSGQSIQNKTIKSARKAFVNSEFSQLLKIKLKQVDSDLFCYLNFKAEEYLSDQFNGLINQGNTCYMNSYLQTLNHIPAFRNLVYESEIQDQSKFPATLQDLFFNLANSQKPVSSQNLVKSFGWGKKQASVQQDAQQFSCLFFEVLQRKLNDSMPAGGYKNMTIHELFKGELNNYLRCTDVSTQNFEEFIDLQIPVMPTLQEALNVYTSEVHLAGDNKYSTQEYGLQQAHKGVKISIFPPILMLQLKRFQYSFTELKNIKILDQMEYEEQFDFSKWSLSGQQQKYELYAVLVHEGAKAESGHYYCFIQTQKGWFKFNDQSVQQVSKDKVFKYNFGGYHQSLEFDAKQMKINRKFIESKSTAYMLVYIKSEMKSILMTDNKKYPEWLLKKDSYKLQLEEIKKNKKHYIHNVKLIDWSSDLKGKQCNDVGFLNCEMIEKAKNIQKIAKKLNILEWLEEKQFDIVQNGKKSKKNQKIMENKSEQNSIGVYTYQKTLQREIVAGYQTKSHHLIEDLLKDSDEPVILKAPVQAKKHEFIVICKKYIITNVEDKFERKYFYDDCFVVQKQTTIKAFYFLLKQKYKSQNSLQIQKNQQTKLIKRKFFIEGEKVGLVNINEDQDGFLPIILPNKNQLLVCVIEQLPYNINEQQSSQHGYRQFYESKRDQITLMIYEQKTKYYWQVKQLSLLMTCTQLRSYIFDQILTERKQEYQSTDNIVIRAKQKRGAKNLSEISEPSIVLKQLIKYENKIEFGYSSLSIDCRIAQEEKIVYYRFEDFRFSEPIQIVVEKNENNQNLVNKFKNNIKIIQFLNQQGYSENQAKLYLFNKDRLMINDYVDNEGKIYSKGDLDTVLKKQKNALIVIQGERKVQNQIKMEIQGMKTEEENQVVILLHHVTQTNDRVGVPRSFRVDKKILLFELRNMIFDCLDWEVYEWQGKTYKFNPFKTRLLLYVTASKKTIQLHDLESLEEMRRLRMEEKSKKQTSKKNKVNESKRKTSTQIQCQVEQVNGKQINNENQQVEHENEESDIKQPESIFEAYPKAKVLRIQVIHNELIKPNIALRLNVDG